MSKKKKALVIPKFKNEDEERDFWAGVDLSEHFDASQFKPVHFPHLKPTSKPISIRLPEYMIVRLKERANAIDIPYQALIKTYIDDGLRQDGASVVREGGRVAAKRKK